MLPEFDGKRFSYPGEQILASPRSVLRWLLTRKPEKWPRSLPNPPPSAVVERVHDKQLKLTFINHATVLIQSGGMNILTDPVFSRYASPVSFAGPRRHRAPGLTIDQLPPIDVILLSHTHYDHLDSRSLKRLHRRDSPRVIAPLKVGHIVSRCGGGQTTELNWWESATLSDSISATLVPARHWTSRRPGDQNMALWGGFVIALPGGSLYFAGDTGYGSGDHFRLARERLGPFRCALIPIGAYEPRWFMQPQHMNPEEAVMAFADLRTAYALAIHHGTFQLTDEAHDAPVEALSAALACHSIAPDRFRALDNGQAWRVPEADSTSDSA